MDEKKIEKSNEKSIPKEKNITKVFIVITLILIVFMLTLLIVLILDKSKVIHLDNLDNNLLKSLSTSKEEFKYGDVNQDNKININDVSLIQGYLSGSKKLSDIQKKLADVDGDNEITEIDAEIIQKRISNLISAFPVENSSIKVYTYGDVNEDLNVNISDVTFIQKYLNGLQTLTELQKKAADVDGDGKVTSIDAEIIQKKLANIIQEFPIENSKVQVWSIGDVDENGKVDINDVTLIQNYLNGSLTLTELQKKAADVNGDNIVNLEDAKLIQQKIVDKKVEFTAETKEVSSNMLGDVNGNGILEISDATLIQKYVAGSSNLTDSQKKLADVDGDGNITSIDAELIQKKIAKSISAFPVEDSSVKGYVIGDVDENGKININDVTLIQKYIKGSQTLNELRKKAADVDGDGKVTDIDAELIQKKLSQKISRFPVEDSNIKYYTLGDVNEDGNITNADAVLVQNYLAKNNQLSAIQKKAADYNEDGIIDINDVTEILQVAIRNTRNLSGR